MSGFSRTIPVRHAVAVVAGYTLLFTWVYARPLLTGGALAESDLYEFFLPTFVAPPTTWSSFEFGGVPAFADPGEGANYPPHWFFARVVGSFTGYVIAAHVLAACFTYAYVLNLWGSRTAAAFAGLAYGLSEALLEQIAHLTTLHSFAWLPLILLSIDRVRGPAPRRWIAFGAVGAACALLAGHPQPALYGYYACALYALAGGLAARASLRYYGAVALMFALGAALTMALVLPVLETSAYTARQTVNFGQFVSRANTVPQMLSMLFPAIEHDGREAPTYVGLATLLFAAVALGRLRSEWRVAFWGLVAIVSLLIGVGDATPVARLAFEVPFYDRFRVSARHLFLASFGLATLAAIGIASLQQQRSRVRSAYAAGLVLAIALAAGAVAVIQSPGAFPLDENGTLPWTLALGALTIAAACTFALRPRHAAFGMALLGILVVDLVAAPPYAVTAIGLEATVIPERALQPSVHARRLARAAQPLHQRILAPAGTHLDSVVPAAFARVWEIPIAGGYGPMLLQSHASLALMGTNGSVEWRALARDNAALDLLAVKYVVVAREDLEVRDTIERRGLTWSAAPVGVAVGPAECAQRHERTLSVQLPAGVTIHGIGLVAHLGCSEDVPQGQEVGDLQVSDAARAPVATLPLRAGVEIADRGLADAAVERRARHGRAQVFDAGDEALAFYTRLDLPRPVEGGRLDIRVTGTPGWLEIDRLTLIDAAGRSLPQGEAALRLGDADRWRFVEAFRTSRVTDRPADETAEGETGSVVFENRRARPRAWIATEIVPLEADAVVEAVHASRLPDGRQFDAGRMAIVEAGASSEASFPDGAATARVASIADGRITVEVASAAGGFLVLSETFYPGWRARIGDTPLTVVRTNGSLQGTTVPAGRHVVVFEFNSATRRTGVTLSLVTLAIVAMLGVLPGRGRGGAR